MMVSNIIVLKDLGPTHRNDGARCSVRVMDGMSDRMAQPSVSGISVDPDCCSSSSECTDESASSSPGREPNLHPITQLVGPLYYREDFELLQKLGEGFFSEVLRVKHRDHNEEMVLKVNKNSANRNRRSIHAEVAREADIMRRLKHENILALKGICLERTLDGKWDIQLLVDFCQGDSLSRLILDRFAPFPWQCRTEFALHIASAMEYIHDQRIMHRDLTSMNVLIRYNDASNDLLSSRAIVADFGLSCSFPKVGEQLPQVGTTYYMSPECLKEEYYDEKSDIFSFGIILCQMIARIEADPDSGLHRTSNFGLDYVLFTPCCPPDTPLELLELAFNSCLLDPGSRPSFATLASSLRKILDHMIQSPKLEKDLSMELRLGRSRSDAALKKPRNLNGRKLSSNIFFNTPIIEGIVDESSITAMKKLASDVAKEEPAYDHHTNPFLIHERFRKERKIVPRVDGRRRSNTKPEAASSDTADSSRRIYRRRCSSIPCEAEYILDPVDEEADISTGRMPMAYRDYDRDFAKSMKRFPSRRHTMIPECLASKTSMNARTHRKRESSGGYKTDLESISASSQVESVIVDKNNEENENLCIPTPVDVVTVQPLSLASSEMSTNSVSASSNLDDSLNNNELKASWGSRNSLSTCIVFNNSKRSENICMPSVEEKHHKCSIL
ncbi:unnamed protein product [Auanema sp. JU1783]|nr:unnamed protein product [Auanema sp. JU1783]